MSEPVVEPVVEQVEPVEPAPIDPNAYEQMKNDMHKFKRMASEATEKQNAYEAKLREIETNQQKASGKYKELYEATAQERETYKEKYENTLNAVVDDKKMASIREFALKNNIRKEALDDLDMIDMSSVVVETTDQGRYNVLGAENFVDGLKALKPHWFTDSTPPVVNNGTGSFDGKDKTYSPSELLGLEKENPGLYREIITKKQHLIRR